MSGPVAEVDNGADVDNEEQGGLLQVCDGRGGRGPTCGARSADACVTVLVISCVAARKFLQLLM